ncbi:MAG: IS21 family transposase [Polyangiaceae bacterium]|jgi:transposase|nr:IS21 family transposase [Polyangiaceae bacterium]
MIWREREAEILRLWHAERWKIGTISAQLGVHHDTVRRVLSQAGVAEGMSTIRPSMVDPFVPLIRQTLEKYPRLRASRLYEMVRQRGYGGGPDHFRHVVVRYRPRPVAEAYLRLRTLAGEQAQVDWGYFGKLAIGRASRPLWGFVMVLSYSRQVFLRFYLGQAMANFVRGHVAAFEAWQAVPRVILYDNLKSAVLERVGQAIHFHPTLLELAAHYHFEPRPVAVGRGNEKGRVERAIRFVRESFFAAREFTDVADLNEQADQWCNTVAAERPCPEDRDRSVREVFEAEKPYLLCLPDNPFPAEDRVETQVARTPYVRFDLNDYSVPYSYVRRPVVVVATLDTVRILDGLDVIATHPRSWDKGEQVEDEQHVRELVAWKRAARDHRGLDRLHRAAPHAPAFFAAVAERDGNLGATTTGLTRLLDLYGATALDQALTEALSANAAHLQAVRHILQQQHHARQQPPPLPVALPDDPRVRDVVVRPHDPATYDQLMEEVPDDDDQN